MDRGNTALLVQQNGAGALSLFASDPEERRRMFLNLIQRDINEDQLRLLFGICDRYGFDPMLKHVILIQKGMYVTRDGMIAYAHSTGELDGIEEVEKKRGPDGKWEVTIAVYRRGCARPFVTTAFQEEHENTASVPWKKSPYRMTFKCAQLAALRMAFPVSLGGAEEVGYDGVGSRTNIGTVIEIDGQPVAHQQTPALLSAPSGPIDTWTDDELLGVMGEDRHESQLRRAAETYYARAASKDDLTARWKSSVRAGLPRALADPISQRAAAALAAPEEPIEAEVVAAEPAEPAEPPKRFLDDNDEVPFD